MLKWLKLKLKKIDLDKWYTLNSKLIHKYYFVVLLIFAIITGIFGYFAADLKVKADLIDLLPKNFPSVKGLEEIQEVFGGIGYLVLVIETEEAKDEIKKSKKNIKINYDYNNDGSILQLPYFDANGIVTGTEKAIKSYYYLKEPSKNGAGKKVEWEADLPKTKLFIREIAKHIKQIPGVAYCDYQKPIDFLKDNQVLYSDIGDLATIFGRIKKKKRDVFLDKIGLKIDLSDKDEAEGIYYKDIEDKYDTDSRYLSSDGYYLSSNNKMFVVMIKSTKASMDIDFANKLYSRVKTVINNTQTKLKKKNQFHPSIKIGYGGRYKRKPESAVMAEKDMNITSKLGLLFIIGIVALYFRRLQTLLIIGLPLITGIIWTFGITFFRFGYVNILTGFLSVILMGLGIDFGIHFLSRYYEERGKGKSIEDSLFFMLSKTGKATLTAVFTTITSFIAMIFTDFKGFNEFGFIGATGLMMAYISMFYILSSLLVVFEKFNLFFNNTLSFFKKSTVQISLFSSIGFIGIYSIYSYYTSHQLNSLMSVPLYYFILPYLVVLKGLIYIINQLKNLKSRFSVFNLLTRTPRFVLTIMVLFVLFSIVAAFTIKFDYNFKKMEGMHINSSQIEEKISHYFSLSLTPSVVIANNEREEELIYDAFTKAKSKKGDDSTIDVIESLSAFIPKLQTEKMELVNELKSLINDFIERAEDEEFQDDKEAQKSKDQLVDIKEELLDNVDYIYPETIPEEIVRQFTKADDEKDTRRVVQIFPILKLGRDGKKIKAFAREVRGIELWETVEDYGKRLNMSKKEVLTKIKKNQIQFKLDDDNQHLIRREVSAAGENLVLADILNLVESEGPYIILTVLFMTILFLFIDFKSLSGVLITLGALLFGLISLFGLMYIFKVQFNILNVVVFPVIIGIGIDSGVHLYHRYLDEGDISKVLKSTGVAVTFASLTTMLGFGALLFANHKGMNSIGELAVLGIGSTFLLSVCFISSVLLIYRKDNFLKKSKVDRGKYNSLAEEQNETQNAYYDITYK